MNHNNENISSDFIQSLQDTSLIQHQFTNPTNSTPIQQTTYESDTDDDSDHSCTNNFSNTHPTYLVNSQLNQNNKLQTVNIQVYLKNHQLETSFLKPNNLET